MNNGLPMTYRLNRRLGSSASLNSHSNPVRRIHSGARYTTDFKVIRGAYPRADRSDRSELGSVRVESVTALGSCPQ